MSDNGGMSCQELVELVTDYLEGALPEDDRAHFEAHLALCPPCVEYVAQIERTVAVVGATWRDVAGEPGTAELLELFGDWQRLSRRLTSRNGAHAVGTATHPNEEEP